MDANNISYDSYDKINSNETDESSRNIFYRVRPSRLSGQVSVSGAKNSVLRLLVASLLTDEKIELTNYPATLRDAQIQTGMLSVLGKTCVVEQATISITGKDKLKSFLDWDERSIRNTLLILGALTARTGHGSVPMPGGCKLGERKHDLHIMLLERLGAVVTETDETLTASAPNGLVGNDIYLPIRSTGATENAILCGALAKGKTTIWGPHIRPEIMDLIDLLTKMGAKISVYGQERIEIFGVEKLGGAKHRVLADNMEALTWLVAAVITGGDLEICDFPIKDLEIPLTFLRESGARFFTGDNSVIVRGGHCYPVEIATGPYPGINSDMQPLFAVFSVMSRGESRIIDLRFPGRYAYAEQLSKMGVNYAVEGNMLKIVGGNDLVGNTVQATDLRAGIALTLAGLVTTKGETIVHDAWQVERGYDRFVEKLRSIGGNIEIGEM